LRKKKAGDPDHQYEKERFLYSEGDLEFPGTGGSPSKPGRGFKPWGDLSGRSESKSKKDQGGPKKRSCKEKSRWGGGADRGEAFPGWGIGWSIEKEKGRD